jgi:hypothetical protein
MINLSCSNHQVMGSNHLEGATFMDQNVVVLLAAIIGGIAAIIGGFVANYVTGKVAKENEQITFVRKKREEIYILTCKICQIHDHLYEEIAGLDEGTNEFLGESRLHNPYVSDDPILCLKVFEDNAEKIAPLAEKCKMIVSLYMRDCTPDFSTWLKDLSDLREKIRNDLSNGIYSSNQVEKYLERTTQSHNQLKTNLSLFAKKKGITKG